MFAADTSHSFANTSPAGSCRIESRLLPRSWLKTLFPPLSSPSCSRCGNLQTLRAGIALKLPLFIMSNWLLDESQPVKEFCSITIGDYHLLQFVLSQQPPSLRWAVISIWFPGKGLKIQAMRQVFDSLGKVPHAWARNQLCLVSQLTDMITILCLRLGRGR